MKKSGIRVLQAGNASLEGYGRYQTLNRMIRAEQAGNTEGLKQELENYRQLDYLTKELFTLL